MYSHYSRIICVVSYGGERYEKRDMQERVRERFMELHQLDMDEVEKQKQQQQQGGGGGDDDDDPVGFVPTVVVPSWTFVDAAQSVEQVQTDVWLAVEETLCQVREQNKPVGKMFAPGALQLPTTITRTVTVVNEDDDDTKIVMTAKASDEENQEPLPTPTAIAGQAK